jgi:hypothetical protein
MENLHSPCPPPTVWTTRGLRCDHRLSQRKNLWSSVSGILLVWMSWRTVSMKSENAKAAVHVACRTLTHLPGFWTLPRTWLAIRGSPGLTPRSTVSFVSLQQWPGFLILTEESAQPHDRFICCMAIPNSSKSASKSGNPKRQTLGKEQFHSQHILREESLTCFS